MRTSVRQQLKIIAAIAAARKEAQISRRELSTRIGAAGNVMQKIENGDRDVTVSEFIAIAQAIGVDPCELLRKALR